jgi:cell division protein FtsL
MVRLIALLVVLVIASSLGVVTCQYKSRQLVTAMEREQLHTRNLQEEWGRMDIEQQSVAALPAVEKVARDTLHMDTPSRDMQISLSLSAGAGR